MFLSLQIEDLDVLLSDHIQKVLKVNFSAAWEEVTAKNELEDTYAFNLKTLDGKMYFGYKTHFYLLFLWKNTLSHSRVKKGNKTE